jgi:hypothetical protein
MGVNLWGESPLYVNPVNVLNILTKVLAEGKGGTVRDRPEEASGKAMSRRTGTAYKAQSPGKSAPHDETLGSGDRVNAAVVQRKFTSLSGEICLTCDEICLVRDPGNGPPGKQRSRHSRSLSPDMSEPSVATQAEPS